MSVPTTPTPTLHCWFCNEPMPDDRGTTGMCHPCAQAHGHARVPRTTKVLLRGGGIGIDYTAGVDGAFVRAMDTMGREANLVMRICMQLANANGRERATRKDWDAALRLWETGEVTLDPLWARYGLDAATLRFLGCKRTAQAYSRDPEYPEYPDGAASASA